MTRVQKGLMRLTLILVAVGLVAAASLKAWQRVHTPDPEQVEIVHHGPRAHLVANESNTIELPDDVASAMQLRTKRVEPAPPPTPLKLEGALFINPNRMTHVHTRFAGEVVELGTNDGNPDGAESEFGDRTLRFGDQVHKGELLAVIWSKDLGEKKSELVDALSRLHLDQETLARLKPLYDKGSIPERTLREQERLVEADQIAVARAIRTLQTWKVSESEINDIRAEAVRIHARSDHVDEDRKKSWARVEVRSALDGTIVEKNVNIGDVVDVTLDLFKIANLTRLDVLAHAYEEDLEVLEELKPEQRRWAIHLKSGLNPEPMIGSFNQIGRIIDPNQHTALVMGWVDNSNGRLRVGQFITSVVELPANPNEVAVPASALVDQEGQTFVFVQPDPGKLKFRMRHVSPTRRHDDLVFIASQVDTGKRELGLEPLQAGEWVVESGCLEMARELSDLTAASQVAHRN